MTFSLIIVQKAHSEGHASGTIDGSWVQDHIGTLESATQAAIQTEAANSNKIDVAVTDQRPGAVARLDRHCFCRRLDQKRPNTSPLYAMNQS